MVVCGLRPIGAETASGPRVHEWSLSGADWTVASFEPGQGVKQRAFAEGYPAERAFSAIVPGDVHWDLERAGQLPPLYVADNSKQAAWVGGKEWWYRKEFRLRDASGKAYERLAQGQRFRLCFDGVDYECDVYLNGQLLGQHEGQFTPFSFEVTEVLRFDRPNMLAVRLYPAPVAVRDQLERGAAEWPMMTTMRAEYSHWKCMTNAGWDWGAKIITAGIWKDVRMRVSGELALTGVTVLPRLSPPYERALLDIAVDCDAPQQRRLHFEALVAPCDAQRADANFQNEPDHAPGRDALVRASHEADCPAGRHAVQFQVEVPRPQLWWPNGYGPQNLYTLEVTVSDALPQANVDISDRIEARFGIRDLKMLPNPLADDYTQYIDYSTDAPVVHRVGDPQPELNYLLQINGRRIFARGGNWIPCDLLYGRPRREFFQHRIRLAAAANYNLFRVWGGGLIDKPEFFELCDEYGIMLFQEFPNAGARLPEDDEALAIAARETRAVLPTMMNHPCIVRYAGGNEWYRDASNSRQMAQLRQICNEMDPTRPYHDPDPETIAQRHGPHGYDHATHYLTYNTGRPMTAGPDNPLEWTEYGASGAASVETLRRIIPAEHLWPIRASDPYWIWHKAFGAYGADNWMASAQYLQLFGELPDLETTVRCSQFVQAEGLRYANQAMRRFQWHRSGCASWTYNEPWPNAAHGCVVEYYGRPKMAYYYTRNAFASVDVSAEYASLVCRTGTPFPLKLFVTSDRAAVVKDCRLKATVMDVQGRPYDHKSWRLDLVPDATCAVESLDLNPPAESAGSVILVQLELCDSTGQLLSAQTYTFGVVEQDTTETSWPLRVPAVSDDGEPLQGPRPLTSKRSRGVGCESMSALA